MGSDSSPFALFDATLEAAKNMEEHDAFTFFCSPAFQAKLQNRLDSFSPSSFHLQVCPSIVEMDASPIAAVSTKKDSSMMTGLQAVREKQIDAFISAGNTGALLVGARLLLNRIPGVRRPALLATLPSRKGVLVVVDVGGNVSCRPEHLLQFAELGAAYLRCLHGIKKAKVGLLNIGVESAKGTNEHRTAYRALMELANEEQIEFIGNIEGRDVFLGKIDLLVTDGFSGNVLLKTAEGVSQHILDAAASRYARYLPQEAMESLKDFHDQFLESTHPAAILCGVDGLVLKCHGNASKKAVEKTIVNTRLLLQEKFTDKLKQLSSSFRSAAGHRAGDSIGGKHCMT